MTKHQRRKSAAPKTSKPSEVESAAEAGASRGRGSFLVVGVGASAGGLEAFGKLLDAMPKSCGIPSKDIAADIGISQRAVENHRAGVMRKTGTTSLPELARLALAAGEAESIAPKNLTLATPAPGAMKTAKPRRPRRLDDQ